MRESIATLTDCLDAASGPAPKSELTQLWGRLPKSQESRHLLDFVAGFGGSFAFVRSFWLLGNDSLMELSLKSLNMREDLRAEYQCLETAIIFATNCLVDLFCYDGSRFFMLTLETGEITEMGATLDGWAKLLLASDSWILSNLSNEWQLENRELEVGEAFIPVRPFVLSGEFETGNLVARPISNCISYNLMICRAIKDVPDGGTISLIPINVPANRR